MVPQINTLYKQAEKHLGTHSTANLKMDELQIKVAGQCLAISLTLYKTAQAKRALMAALFEQIYS